MGRVISRPPLPDGPFLVVGLARSGVAAALALREGGARVAGCDSGRVPEEVVERLAAAEVELHAGTDGVAALGGVTTVIKSPGVPPQAPVIAAARERGIEVMGELELGWRMLAGHEFLAVTGSNGKTTTVHLLGHILEAAAWPAVVAGNVGTALTSLPGTLQPGATVVCEASSFQLEDTLDFAPEAGLLINLAEDHLDRHGTFAAYRAAKLELFARQPEDAIAVLPLGFDTADVGGRARRVRFGAGPDAELAEREDRLWWRGEPLLAVEAIRLRGLHNRENAMAAAAMALASGVPADAVREGLSTFGGLAHRLEEVAEAGGVLYVNDSKATNVASAAVGISSFPGGVHVILGGRAKGGGYAGLVAPVSEHSAAAYLIGETAGALHEALEPAGVPLHDCGDLERAMAAASAAARPGDVILLSPAHPSYDQYRSYEERGEHFRRLAVEASARGCRMPP